MPYRSISGLVAGLLLASATLAAGQANCRSTKATPQNAKACIVVSTTPVIVASKNTSRCSLTIINKSSNPTFCMDFETDGNPTGSTGIPVGAQGALQLGLEGQNTWKCIRDSAATADALMCVGEGMP